MALTKFQIENAKPRDKAYKLGDSGGLFLLIHPNGGKYWRFKYRYLTREKVLALGVYPDVTILDARNRRDKARRELFVDEKDPGAEKKRRREEAIMKDRLTFEKVARDWHGRQDAWSAGYRKQVMQRLENDVFPRIGRMGVSSIRPQDLLSMARAVEERGAIEMSHRALQICGQILQSAVIEDFIPSNPARDLRNVLKTRKVKHRDFLEEGDLNGFFAKLETYGGHIETVLGIKLLMLTAVRPGEMLNALWSEFDFDKQLWIIPEHRMKMGKIHFIPISKQAINVLTLLHKHTGNREHLLPSPSSPRQPLSNGTFSSAMNIMGYKGRATPHGFRATASTILNESGKFDPQAIERQLAHQPANKVKRAYDRAEFLQERTKMMTWYGDHLEKFGLIT